MWSQVSRAVVCWAVTAEGCSSFGMNEVLGLYSQHVWWNRRKVKNLKRQDCFLGVLLKNPL